MANPQQSPRQNPASSENLNGLWVLTDLAAQLQSLDDPGVFQEEILDHAVRMLRCQSGAVCLWEPDRGRMRLGPTIGTVQGIDPNEILMAADVQSEVIGKRRPLVLAAGHASGLGPAAWRQMAIIPMTGHEQILGLIVVGDMDEGDGFSDFDLGLMAAISHVAGSAMETRLEFAQFRSEMGRRMTDAMAELTRAAAELHRLKTFNEELFDSAPVGIIVFDRDLRVTFRNDAADRLWPEDRSVPTAARQTSIGQRDADWEANLRDVVNMHRPWMVEDITFNRPGRDPIRVTLTCSPLMSVAGTVTGGVLIVEDVTLRARMEQRLAVSERLAGVGRLAAMVAHEINNPLDGIVRLVNLARRNDADKATTEKYLAEAHKGLLRLAVIVRSLLDFSRTAAGTAEPRSISETLTETAQALAPAAEMAGVQIVIDCPSDLPALKSGILYQVVLNLAKNAIEAMPKGGRVELRARCQPDAVSIEVADSGPGIPAAVMPMIFEPFYSMKASGQGTGLGLVICRDLVEKQGGTITVANQPEGGAMFTVQLPLMPFGKAKG